MLQLQFIIVPGVALVALVVGVVLLVTYYRVRVDSGRWKLIDQRDYNHGGLAAAGGALTGFAGIMLIITLLICIPFQTKYWVITHPSGTVAANTFTPGQIQQAGDTYTIYALRLQGDPNQYVINDARASQFKPGDRINLACTLQWNYGGQDQWNCGLGK